MHKVWKTILKSVKLEKITTDEIVAIIDLPPIDNIKYSFSE